jgi:hypothetical protein
LTRCVTAITDESCIRMFLPVANGESGLLEFAQTGMSSPMFAVCREQRIMP